MCKVSLLFRALYALGPYYLVSYMQCVLLVALYMRVSLLFSGLYAMGPYHAVLEKYIPRWGWAGLRRAALHIVLHSVAGRVSRCGSPPQEQVRLTSSPPPMVSTHTHCRRRVGGGSCRDAEELRRLLELAAGRLPRQSPNKACNRKCKKLVCYRTNRGPEGVSILQKPQYRMAPTAIMAPSAELNTSHY